RVLGEQARAVRPDRGAAGRDGPLRHRRAARPAGADPDRPGPAPAAQRGAGKDRLRRRPAAPGRRRPGAEGAAPAPERAGRRPCRVLGVAGDPFRAAAGRSAAAPAGLPALRAGVTFPSPAGQGTGRPLWLMKKRTAASLSSDTGSTWIDGLRMVPVT